jgi:hypothetical protein
MSAFINKDSDRSLRYRITGPQSIERLEPLLHTISGTKDEDTGNPSGSTVGWVAAEAEIIFSDRISLDFVWETTCERAWKEAHLRARVLNRLHNSAVDARLCSQYVIMKAFFTVIKLGR